MTQFVLGVVVGGSVVGLLTIVFAPWRRVRSEPPLERDTETRVLLGQDPDEPTGTQPAVPPADADEQFSPAEIAQLRRIGSQEQKRRRR